MPPKSFSLPLTKQSPALIPSKKVSPVRRVNLWIFSFTILIRAAEQRKEKSCFTSDYTQKRPGFDKSYAFKAHISSDMLFVPPFICPKINDLRKYKDRDCFDSFSYYS